MKSGMEVDREEKKINWGGGDLGVHEMDESILGRYDKRGGNIWNKKQQRRRSKFRSGMRESGRRKDVNEVVWQPPPPAVSPCEDDAVKNANETENNKQRRQQTPRSARRLRQKLSSAFHVVKHDWWLSLNLLMATAAVNTDIQEKRAIKCSFSTYWVERMGGPICYIPRSCAFRCACNKAGWCYL